MEKNNFKLALYNAFGNNKYFEREILNIAFKNHYKGNIFLKLNKLLNLSLSNDIKENEYILLKINLDNLDIYNFISEIDYSILEKSYIRARILAKS